MLIHRNGGLFFHDLKMVLILCYITCYDHFDRDKWNVSFILFPCLRILDNPLNNQEDDNLSDAINEPIKLGRNLLC